MIARRRIGLFLIIGGILLVGVSGFFWRGDPARQAGIAAQIAALEDSSSRLRAEEHELELKKRGFQESIPSMPDTVKRYGGAKLMEISGGYTRRLYMLGMKQRELQVDIKGLERDAREERAGARAQAVPVAAAAGAVLVIGVVLMAIPARRVGA